MRERMPVDYVPSNSRLKFVRVSEKRVGKEQKRCYDYMCMPPCGKIISIPSYSAKSGNTLSCGCLRREMIIDRMTSHGLMNHDCYHVWRGMKERCSNPNHKRYQDYAGRGIVVCDEWIDDFTQFVLDMGDRPKGYSLERIDNNKGYQPDNCKWASSVEQGSNKRNNVIIEFNGKSQTLSQWCRDMGINRDRVRGRIRLGWTQLEALELVERK